MKQTPTTIEQDNQNFQSKFRLINMMWVVISFLSISLSGYFTFHNHPPYLQDWHAPVILLLMAFTLALYCFGVFSRTVFTKDMGWPPPFQRSVPYWSGIYLCVSLLSFLDPNFTYAYFIVLGMGFALFPPRILVAIAVLIFLSFCFFQQFFTPPMTQDKLGNMLGIGISFLSLTLFCMWMQHLISERYERTCLLTELTHTNAELEAAQSRLAESAAQAQELAVLRERTRLAREMHDTVGHALVLITIKLEAAQRLRERDPERCDRELEATREIARGTMSELRASIANLRSPTLQHEPACHAISRYAQDMAQRAGLQVSCNLDSEVDTLPEPVEETLWKVGQEALTNIEKHSRAQQVWLHISRRDGAVVMRIADDGVGLPEALYKQHEHGALSCFSPLGHFGLSGMAERVENMNGRICIRPGEPNGTTIEVELPLVEAPLLPRDAQRDYSKRAEK